MSIAEHVTGLQHLGLPTAALDETAAFYESLGFVRAHSTVNPGTGERVCFLTCGGLCIETYECAAPARALGALVPKNLFLSPRSHSAYVLLLTRPEAPFRTSGVSRQLGLSRLGFGPEEKLWEYLRTRPGAVSPLGLLFDETHAVRLAVDARLQEEERLAFHPCENTWSVAMAGADFFGRFLPALGYAPEWVSLEEER